MAGYRSQHPCLYRIGNRQLYSEHSFCIRYGQKSKPGQAVRRLFHFCSRRSDLKQCRLKARHDGSRPVLEPFLHHR